MQIHDFEATHVVVAHPDPLLTMGLAAALREQAGIRAHLPGAENGGDRLDVTITDYEQGLRLAAENRLARRVRPRILVLAQQDREHEVRQALETGVHGYLLHGCRVEELVDGIRALALGQRYMSVAVAQRVADSMSRETLTVREAEVLGLLADGHCNKAIARELDIAVGTVKAHVKGIMNKLDVSSRTQAVSVAVARGMVGALRPHGTTDRMVGADR
jgi:DNA-binding NarL/FixJ family response regulator